MYVYICVHTSFINEYCFLQGRKRNIKRHVSFKRILFLYLGSTKREAFRILIGHSMPSVMCSWPAHLALSHATIALHPTPSDSLMAHVPSSQSCFLFLSDCILLLCAPKPQLSSLEALPPWGIFLTSLQQGSLLVSSLTSGTSRLHFHTF